MSNYKVKFTIKRNAAAVTVILKYGFQTLHLTAFPFLRKSNNYYFCYFICFLRAVNLLKGTLPMFVSTLF